MMYFDSENFKYWFDHKTNPFNPKIPPKTLADVLYIPLYAMAFGWFLIPLALLVSTKLGTPDV